MLTGNSRHTEQELWRPGGSAPPGGGPGTDRLETQAAAGWQWGTIWSQSAGKLTEMVDLIWILQLVF